MTKKNSIKGEPINYPAAVMSRYSISLQHMVDKMAATTKYQIEKLFNEDHVEEYFAQDASVSSSARILMTKLFLQFENLFAEYAKVAARKWALETNEASQYGVAISLRDVAKKITLKTDRAFTPEIRELMTAAVAQNVSLIKSISSQYMTNVTGAVMRSITTGNGLADLIPYLEKEHGITKRRANDIAIDQTRKAYSSFNKSRMQKLGIDEFEWMHSGGGQHPRKLHEMTGPNGLNKNIYSFDNLPVIDLKTGERGIPGQLINCRCRMRAIITFD